MDALSIHRASDESFSNGSMIVAAQICNGTRYSRDSLTSIGEEIEKTP